MQLIFFQKHHQQSSFGVMDTSVTGETTIQKIIVGASKGMNPKGICNSDEAKTKHRPDKAQVSKLRHLAKDRVS